MTRKGKKMGLPVLAGILVVLAGSYVGLTKYKETQEEKKAAQESLEEENSKIYLNQMENITSMSCVNGEVSMEFSKKDDQWIVTELPDFPLKQSYPETIAGILESLEATRKFDSPDALADYGLDHPSVIVKAADDAGNTVTIYVGNTYDSEYYAYINEDASTVYTIGSALVENTNHELYDMIELEQYPSLSEDVVASVELTLPEGTFLLEKETIEAESTEKDDSVQETSGEDSSAQESSEESAASGESTEEETEAEPETVWYVSCNGGERQKIQKNDAIEELMSILTSISIKDCVNYKADTTQMADYGLGEDASILKVTYMDGEDTIVSTLYIGTLDAENGTYYVRMNDSQAVNRVAEDSLNGLMNLDFSK